MYNICLMGLGNIAPRIAKGIKYSKADLYAVASRDKTKAKSFAQEYGAKHYYSYEEMLLDDKIDIVYIATPNYLHHKHVLSCLNAGKNVICEKPIFTDLKELTECFSLAKRKGLLLMEAHKGLFTPLTKKIKKMIDEGEIGEIKMIEAQYATNLKGQYDKLSFWSKERPGAGCLFDLGVYPIAYMNYIASSKIKNYQLDLKKEAGFVTFAQGMIEYDNKIRGHFLTSWESDCENCAHIYGTRGSLHIPKFWKNTKAKLLLDDQEKMIEVEMNSDFTGEIDHFCACLARGLNESQVMSYEASKAILQLLR